MRIFPDDSAQNRTVPAYAADPQYIGVRVIELDNARDNEEMKFPASNVLWVTDASDSLANMEVRFETPTNDKVPLSNGFGVENIRFTKLYLTHSAQAGKTLTLFYIKEGAGFINFTNRQQSASQVELQKATVIDTVDDVTLGAAAATQIVPADSDRREVHVTNMTGGTIRVGDINVAAASGVRIADGDTYILAGTFAVYGYSVAGGDVSITVIKD